MVSVMVVAEQRMVVGNGRHRAASAGTVADVVDEHGGYGARSGKARCPGGSPRRGDRVRERRGQGEVSVDGEQRRPVRARRRDRAHNDMLERHGRGRVWGV